MNEFKTFTSFSVDNAAAAKEFYTEKLNLDSPQEPAGSAMIFSTGGDTSFMIYEKEDHAPAGYTVLNFNVEDVESVVDRLAANGVSFEMLEGVNEKGIREMGPSRAAWFRDPAGNWIGLFQGL